MPLLARPESTPLQAAPFYQQTRSGVLPRLFSKPRFFNGLLPQFLLYLHPPPKGWRGTLNSALLPAPLSKTYCCPGCFLYPSHNRGLGPTQAGLLTPENCDPLSCQPDPNTVPAGTLPLPWFIKTSKLLLWPPLSSGPSPSVVIFF